MSFLLPINESLNSSSDTKKKNSFNKDRGTEANNLCSSSYFTKYLITTDNDASKDKFKETMKRKLTSREQGLINLKNINILKQQNKNNYIHHTYSINKKPNKIIRHNKEPALISLRMPDSSFHSIPSNSKGLQMMRFNSTSQLFQKSNTQSKQLPKQSHLLLSLRNNYSEVNHNNNNNNNIDSDCSSIGRVIYSKTIPLKNNISINKNINDNNKEKEKGHIRLRLENVESMSKDKRILPTGTIRKIADEKDSQLSSTICLRYSNNNKFHIISPQYYNSHFALAQLYLNRKVKSKKITPNHHHQQLNKIKSYLRKSSNSFGNNNNEPSSIDNNNLIKSPSSLKQYLSQIKREREHSLNAINNSNRTNVPVLFKLNQVKIQFPKTLSASSFSINEANNSTKHYNANEYKRSMSKSP